MTSNSNLSQLRRGVLGPLVLTLIGQRERYGLELVKALSEHDLVVSEGTVYPLLSRLVANGLVESEWLISGRDRPRRVYRLTDDGARDVHAFRSDWKLFASAVQAVLADDAGDDTKGEAAS
jgi:PadR family transcriptional regulator PadR